MPDGSAKPEGEPLRPFGMYRCGASHPAVQFNKSLHPQTGLGRWISQLHVDQQRIQVRTIRALRNVFGNAEANWQRGVAAGRARFLSYWQYYYTSRVTIPKCDPGVNWVATFSRKATWRLHSPINTNLGL